LICSGEEDLQQAVMASAVPGTLTVHLAAEEAGVKEAAAWCVLNLSSSDTPSQQPQVGMNVTRLCSLFAFWQVQTQGVSSVINPACIIDTVFAFHVSVLPSAVGAGADTHGSLHIAG
jgi:hypothetical protein